MSDMDPIYEQNWEPDEPFPVTLAGQCVNGFGRNHGRVIHYQAEPPKDANQNAALCGKRPGARSTGFYPARDQEIANLRPCPRCAKKAGLPPQAP